MLIFSPDHLPNIGAMCDLSSGSLLGMAVLRSRAKRSCPRSLGLVSGTGGPTAFQFFCGGVAELLGSWQLTGSPNQVDQASHFQQVNETNK